MADPTPNPPAPTSAPATLWQKLWKTARPLLVALVAAVIGAAVQYFGGDGKVVEKLIEKQVEKIVHPTDEWDGLIDRHGWQPDAIASAADAADAQFPTFGDTPAGQVQAQELPKFVYGWKSVEKLTGKPAPMKDQNPTGACVGFGTTTAIERTEATEVLLRRGDKSEFAFFSEEVTYAGSKVQGARSMNATVSRSDGSAGVFAKAWVTKVGGMVPKGKYGTLDLMDYNAARAHSWNLTGCPAALVPVAKKFPVKDSVKIANWEQAKQAMASGYFPALCSNQGFTYKRDAEGKCYPSGRWDHCMCLDGYHTDDRGDEWGHIENSWSNVPDKNGNRIGPAHTGPVGWGNPTGAGFWASAKVIDGMCRQGDTFAYSGVTGFPARKPDWFVQTRPARQPFELADLFALAP